MLHEVTGNGHTMKRRTPWSRRGAWKAHQHSDPHVAHAEVGEKLGFMSSKKAGDRFDCECDPIFGRGVGAKAHRDRYALVNEGNRNLGFETDPGAWVNSGAMHSAYPFQPARTNGAIDLDGEANKLLR